MKLITAVMRPATFDILRDALATFGVHGMTVAEVHGSNPLTSHVEIYRGQRIVMALEPRLRIDLLAPDDDAADLLRVITKIATSPNGGSIDSMIWMSHVDLVIRVRTGERGLDAL